MPCSLQHKMSSQFIFVSDLLQFLSVQNIINIVDSPKRDVKITDLNKNELFPSRLNVRESFRKFVA